MKKMLPKYKVFDHKSIKDLSCVLIESGEFEGIVYHYGVVSVDPDKDGDVEIPVKYSYKIVDGTIAEDKVKEFEKVTSSILFSIITEEESK